MAKLCKCGCGYPVFSNGYSKYCQYKREYYKAPQLKKTPIKASQKPIKKHSERRKKQVDIYHQEKIKLLTRPHTDQLRCFISDTPLRYNKEKGMFVADLHHLDGKEEKLLLDFDDNIVIVKRRFHGMVHDFHILLLLETEWHEGFLLRLKHKRIDLWEKELYKQVKSHLITIEEYNELIK